METIHLVRLQPLWNGMRLTGHHWRLYVHDAPGAGVVVNEEKLELSPGFAWLLPPHGDLPAWCENPALNQLYLHFEVARRLGMPVNAFIRRFQAGTGSTPYQYLTNLRYTRAARLLEEGELSIDDICETVGVKDRFHFSRMFKRLHGLSPAAYRQGYRPR